jgi:hypothetical protein
MPTVVPFGMRSPGTSALAPTVTLGGGPGRINASTTLSLSVVPLLQAWFTASKSRPAALRVARAGSILRPMTSGRATRGGPLACVVDVVVGTGSDVGGVVVVVVDEVAVVLCFFEATDL